MDKVISLAEAAGLVHDGDTLALGGMTLYRRPVAFVRELLRTAVRDLTLLCFTASGHVQDRSATTWLLEGSEALVTVNIP